jgi:hypothetical protein
MQQIISCIECVKKYQSSEVVSLQITNDGIYSFKCKNGHDNHIFSQNPKFETLIDMGVLAFIDEYYRESVFNFVSAIEEFHRFFIKTILLEKEISKDECDKTWNALRKKSESQLGAFYSGYLISFGKVAPLFVRNNEEFRNKIVHNGYIPDQQKSEKYIDGAFNYIKGLIKELNSALPGAINKIIMIELSKLTEQFRKKYTIDNFNPTTLSAPGILRCQDGDTFQSYLSSFKQVYKNINIKKEF